VTVSEDLAHSVAHPSVGISELVIRAGALEDLAAVVRRMHGGGTVAVLVDALMYLDRTGADVKRAALDALAEFDTHTVVLAGAVHADEATVDLASAGCAAASVVVTVGSGTLSDIGKVAAKRAGARHVIVQSAVSVNGFADDQSVLLIKGVKRTSRSGWPDALIIDSDVLVGAPVALNNSGLGDMISMFTAPADWYLSSLFGMDRGWDEDAALLTRRHGEELLASAAGVGRAEPEKLHLLAEFLTLSGFSMGIAGQTSPSSGMEHTVSHMLDMAKGARHEDTAYHGAQVAVATAVASILWRRMSERLAAGGLDHFDILDDERARERVFAAFGWMDEDQTTAEECWSDYSQKIAYLRSIDAGARLRDIRENWQQHSEVLRGMIVAPERVVDAITMAGAPARFSDLNASASPEDVYWAVAHCHLMRNRFTIADLAFATGFWTEVEVRSVLNEAAAIGTGL